METRKSENSFRVELEVFCEEEYSLDSLRSKVQRIIKFYTTHLRVQSALQ